MKDEILERWKRLKHKEKLLFKMFNKDNNFISQVTRYFTNLEHTSTQLAKIEELETLDVEYERREVLKSTDWTQLADANLTSSERAEFRNYRQYLRDLPKLWKNKQILENRVMDFEEWRENPPIYEKKRKIKL